MVVVQDKSLRNGHGQKNLMREPLRLKGLLDEYKSFEVTPVIGREFPEANVVEWMKAPNSDELLRDLAVLSTYPNMLLIANETYLINHSLSPRRGLLPRPNRSD